MCNGKQTWDVCWNRGGDKFSHPLDLILRKYKLIVSEGALATSTEEELIGREVPMISFELWGPTSPELNLFQDFSIKGAGKFTSLLRHLPCPLVIYK